MAASGQRPLRGISYHQARILVLVAGLLILLVTALVMYVRRVETVEVAAILFFLPIFVAFVFWEIVGGLTAGVAASIGYVLLRLPAIHAVGGGKFTGLIVSRSLAFVIFGVIGGAADKQLESSLTKLDLYDQVDDHTGLFNARFFVQDTDLEMSRSKRYHTIFSVAVVDVPLEALQPLGRRGQQQMLRQLGQALRDSVRTVDRAVYADDGKFHRLAVVLPETGKEGVTIFADRLAQKVTELVSQKGASVGAGGIPGAAFTFPDDEQGLEQLREQFAAIDKVEHPETAQDA
ncbi:MAG: diguanylate cyclase [Actinobacteria bacterium]|nr:diguanylate cyclase [Actinomycetota bacterium]